MGTKLKSIRTKLFLTLVVVVIVIIIFLIALNNFVLETFYLFSKQRTLINTYKKAITTPMTKDNAKFIIVLDTRCPSLP